MSANITKSIYVLLPYTSKFPRFSTRTSQDFQLRTPFPLFELEKSTAFFQLPLDANVRLALLQILEDRYERKSMIIASQLPLDKWYDYIAEPTLADAIMDRLVSNATHIEMKGESMRRRKKK